MFKYTEIDKEKVIKGYFKSIEPLKLRQFPPKQKKKYIVLDIIIEVFDKKKEYTESELNLILKEVYPDFVSIRRGLIDYKFMERTKDCSKYWVTKKD